MILALVALALILTAVIVAVSIVDFVTGPPFKREVIVHTRKPDDQSIRGVLTRRNRRWIRLEAASYLDGENKIALEGEVIIRASNISFIQAI